MTWSRFLNDFCHYQIKDVLHQVVQNLDFSYQYMLAIVCFLIEYLRYYLLNNGHELFPGIILIFKSEIFDSVST